MNFVDKLDSLILGGNPLLKEGGEFYLSDRYIPEEPPFREKHIVQHVRFVLSSAINETSDTILLEGPTGTGKTMTYKITELYFRRKSAEGKVPDVVMVYINGRDKTVFEVVQRILADLGVILPSRGFSLGYYLSFLEKTLRRMDRHVHVCIDEVDKVGWRGEYEVEDLLYALSRYEGISSTIITNDFDFVERIKDPRARSSMTLDKSIVFERYTTEQCFEILRDRCVKAFRPEAISDRVIRRLAELVSFETGDIRDGLSTLRSAAKMAAERGMSALTEEVIEEAWREIEERRFVEKIRALPESLRIVLMAMYFVWRDTGREAMDSRAVHSRVNELREKLGVRTISEQTLRVQLYELVTYGLLEVRRAGRGRGRGIERVYGFAVSPSVLHHSFRSDPVLSSLFDSELKSMMEERVRAFRGERGL